MEIANNNRVLLPLLIFISVVVVLLTGSLGTVVNLTIFGVIGFVSVFYFSYRYPRYNFTFIMTLAVFMPFLIKVFRLYRFPITNAIEVLSIVLFLILVINRKISGFKTIPGILLILWMFYQFAELANPEAASRIAGIAHIRGLVPLFCMYFVVYSSTETKKDVYIFFTGMLVLGILSGLYGLYQEFAGLPEYDQYWATSTESLYNLLFTWGRMRKFSFFYSPTDFGMLMVLIGVAALIGLFLFRKNSVRVFCGVTSLICFWSMLYTGTRTAMVMMAVGFFVFAFITLDKRALITMAVFALVIVGLLFRPTTSRSLFVMMTAFSASNDPSMNVRLKNQQIIRGYIQAKPIGFGLGSTGWLGLKYSPDTFIGSFPPDSEYVKIAIETGWVGLLFWCVILAILFSYGVSVYFKLRDHEWKAIMTILLSLLFMLIVAQYPQEILRSQVLTILLASLIGLIAKIGTKAATNSF